MDICLVLISKDKPYMQQMLSVLPSEVMDFQMFFDLNEAMSHMSARGHYIIVLDQECADKEGKLEGALSELAAYDTLPRVFITSSDSQGMGIYTAADSLPLKPEAVVPRANLRRLKTLVEETLRRINIAANSEDTIAKQFHLKTDNPAFRKTISYCRRVAASNANILLVGESGTGKEVAAKYIHALSPRSSRNFVPINCSSYTETLLESELFGHEKGAFTGALKTRLGKFDTANHGTLFLDEVGDISTPIQIKLLRVIDSKQMERLGSDIVRNIDFRLVSATNRDLGESVSDGTFRMDFFYRISTIVIALPPLRQRPEDLDALIHFFMEQSKKENKKTITRMEPEVMEFLHRYDYPGNIRELKNIIDRMVVLSDEDGVITKDGLPIMFSLWKKEKADHSLSRGHSIPMPAKGDPVMPLKEYRELCEAEYLKWVLEYTGGNVAEAARQLNITARQLFNKINLYGLKVSR